MTEEVSSQIRLSVTITLLASVVAVVAAILTMWVGVMQSFADRYVDANNQVFSTVIMEMQGKDSIEAPVIYKVARESDQVSLIKILNADDSVAMSFDFTDAQIEKQLKYFINNANKRYKVRVDVRDGYVLSLWEVTQ